MRRALVLACAAVGAGAVLGACTYTESEGLVARPPVSGVEAVTTTTEAIPDDGEDNVALGDTGPAVARWQIRLGDWLAVSAGGARIPVTGLFDAGTEAATRRFQTEAAIPADGVVDAEDRAVMETTLTDLEAAAPPLERGATGPAAESWQAALNDYFAAVAPEVGTIAVDGQFGPGTERAQRQFEERAGLVTDGIVTGEDRLARRIALLELQTDVVDVLVAVEDAVGERPAFELFAGPAPEGDEVCFRLVSGDTTETSCGSLLGEDVIRFLTVTTDGSARVAAGLVTPEVRTVRLVSLGGETTDLTPTPLGGDFVFGGRLPENSLEEVQALDETGAVIGTAAG